MRKVSLLIFLTFLGCTEMRVKKYADLLDPRVGDAKKDEIGSLLGPPTTCTSDQNGERCEYRTARARNHPVPDVYRKESSLGPDLSPYDHFDVLQLRYDGFGVLQSWEPMVIHPN